MPAFLAFFLAVVSPLDSRVMDVQVHLDSAGYSCNTIDGVWGLKSRRALQLYLADRHLPTNPLPSPEKAWQLYFSNLRSPYRIETVTAADLASLTKIPATPADKAKMPRLGFETLPELLAERGHLSRRAFERLNPGIDWSAAKPGLKVVMPDFPSQDSDLKSWPRNPNKPPRPTAARLAISLSRYEISAFDAHGRRLGLFPCSIAASKSKLPACGTLRLTTSVANPNYTYTPDEGSAATTSSRLILPAGPNCPVGIAWLGLNLPGYGIHGTPTPESIGNAESHGCFRLANWNAARLYSLCPTGIPVVVEP